MDASLISEESACENSRGMKEMGVFGKLFYTMAQCDFNLEYMQGVLGLRLGRVVASNETS